MKSDSDKNSSPEGNSSGDRVHNKHVLIKAFFQKFMLNRLASLHMPQILELIRVVENENVIFIELGGGNLKYRFPYENQKWSSERPATIQMDLRHARVHADGGQ